MKTPETKNEVLSYLCKNYKPGIYTNVTQLLESIDLDPDDIHAVLLYFERIGFIQKLNFRYTAVWLALNTEAIDYYNKGGFDD